MSEARTSCGSCCFEEEEPRVLSHGGSGRVASSSLRRGPSGASLARASPASSLEPVDGPPGPPRPA